jgi:hypothetical protein
MKSLKKTLVLLVVFSMILSTLVPAFAATDVIGLDCEEQVTRMEALGVIEGFEDGTFRPEDTITRAQMAVIVCKMLGINEAAANANANVSSKFSDVVAGEWYTGWVNLASNNGIISGYPDGTFRPSQTLTLNEVLTLCVKALGRGGYVDKMGTWPANYVTEAARLNLLKDVKGAADANRGNVAVICWNTLNAATWYVNSESLNGEVNLSDANGEGKTLLAINFDEYTTEKGVLKEIEGLTLSADVTVAKNDRQLVIKDTLVKSAEDDVNFAADFAREPKKNKDEKSFKDTKAGLVYVYVPEEVCEDLDDLVGKVFTLILGEDDVATLIIIEDDIQEKDYLTAFDSTKGKITVGGTKYTLADSYTVTLNGLGEYNNNLTNALKAVGVTTDLDDIEKVIEAEVTLDGEDEVKAIMLTASYTVPSVSFETLVLKVKETSSTYKITTTKGELAWDLEEEEEEELDFPKVFVDGVKGDIRDIEAGNVLTVITTKDDFDAATVADIEKIYVSTKTVTGEPTKITKADNAIRVDGTYYAPSFDLTDAKIMTTETLAKAKGTWEKFDSNKILTNEEVTLYLNVYGEYVAISLEETASEYTFGIVTYVASNLTNSGDEEEIEEVKVRVLLPKGNKKYFTLSLDTADEDLMEEIKSEGNSVMDFLPTEGDFVMFEADADGVITIEDTTPFVEVKNVIGNIGETDYIVAQLKGDIDEKEFTVKYGEKEVSGSMTDLTIDAEYDANETVIYNLDDMKIVAKWDSIVEPKAEGSEYDKFAGTTYMVFKDEDADVPMFVITDLDKYISSDAVYAIAGADGVYQVNKKDYADLVGTDGIEFSSTATAKDVVEGWVVEYAMSSSKLSSAFSIIDLNTYYNKDTKKHVATVKSVTDFTTDRDGTEGDPKVLPATQLKVDSHADLTLEYIQLANIKTRSKTYRLEFVDVVEDDAIADVDVDDEDLVVYDLRAKSVEEMDIEDLQAEVAEPEAEIYVIVCNDGTNDIIFVL